MITGDQFWTLSLLEEEMLMSTTIESLEITMTQN